MNESSKLIVMERRGSLHNDEEYIKLRDAKEKAELEVPKGRFRARQPNKGGSLKKKRRKYFFKKKTRKNKSK